jgi:hypothetical protein
MFGGEFTGCYAERNENSGTYYHAGGKGYKAGTNRVKYYERGRDGKRETKDDGKPWWAVEDLDRLRLEFLITNARDGKKLQTVGAKSIGGFIRSPKMVDVLKGKLDFCVFEGSNRLPLEGMPYRKLDSSGEGNCFQQEFLAAKARGINPCQYKKKSTLMTPLMDRIHRALVHHDKGWHRQTASLLGRYARSCKRDAWSGKLLFNESFWDDSIEPKKSLRF